MEILIWRIGEFFTKSPNLIPPNMRARDYERNSAQRGRVWHIRNRQIKIRQKHF